MRIDINFNKTTQNKTHISKFLLRTYIPLSSNSSRLIGKDFSYFFYACIGE